MNKGTKLFGWEFWLAVTLALVSAAAYAHTTFVTRVEADKSERMLLEYMIRIENKVDRLLERN